MALTHAQMCRCVAVGLERTERSFRRGWSNKYGYGDENGRLKINIESACSELEVAERLGVEWVGDPFNTGPDLCQRVQVRWTELPHGSLIVRDKDADDHIFILVTGEGPDYVVHGWTWAHQAKQPHYLFAGNGRPPCWMVPQGCPPLRPLSELKGIPL